MTADLVHEAFGAEGRQLSRVLAGLDDAAFACPTACAPWTVAELVYHMRMTMGRLPGMLAAPEPAGPGLVSAAGYYRAGRRFSTATNAGRIESAQRGAAALAGAADRARDVELARRQAGLARRGGAPGG